MANYLFSTHGSFFLENVVVMHDATERPKAVQAGTVKRVGTDVDRARHYLQMSPARNPCDDGRVAERIAQVLTSISTQQSKPTHFFKHSKGDTQHGHTDDAEVRRWPFV